MAKRKTTVYIDDSVLRAAKIAAVREGKREYQVIEDALRSHLGLTVMERVGARAGLKESEALSLAYREVHRARK